MAHTPDPGGAPSGPAAPGTDVDAPSPPADAGVSAYRRLWRQTRFRNLLLAATASSLGDWIGVFAIISLTTLVEGAGRGAAFAVSGVMIARVLPSLLFGPLAGVFADRWDRKRTMIATDFGRAGAMFLLVFSGDAVQLFFWTLLVELMAMLFAPAKDATIPNIVETDDLVVANQLNLLVTYGTLPLGAGLFAALLGITNGLVGGGFLADRPQAIPIWVNAGTFLVSAVFISRIAMPKERQRVQIQVDATEGHNALKELKEGLLFVVRHGLMGGLVIGVMGAFFAAGVVVGVGPFFVKLVNASESAFGLLGVFVGGGLIAGLLSATWLSDRIDKERLFAPAIGLAGVALLLVAFSPRLLFAIPMVFLMGAGAGLGLLVGYTMIQEHADDELRGRTFAAFNTGARVSLFTALVVGGFLVGAVGPVPPGADGIYPYGLFDGSRMTLAFAGAIAVAGAVWSGRGIYTSLTSESEERLTIPSPHGLPGLFVVFEGGEGAGKTTQIERLRRTLDSVTDIEVIVTREPGGTALGEALRDLVLSPETGRVVGRAEALLFAAARAQHVEEKIRPALERGAIVISDRYVDSSVVYQGTARGLGSTNIERLNRWATDALAPDLTVLLDVDPKIGLRRAGAGGGTGGDRLEQAGMMFHEVVNAGFRARATAGTASGRSRWLVLDGTQEPDVINGRILQSLGIAPGEADVIVERQRTTGRRDTLVVHTGELRAALTGSKSLEELATLERAVDPPVPDLTPPTGTPRTPAVPPPPPSA